MVPLDCSAQSTAYIYFTCISVIVEKEKNSAAAKGLW